MSAWAVPKHVNVFYKSSGSSTPPAHFRLTCTFESSPGPGDAFSTFLILCYKHRDISDRQVVPRLPRKHTKVRVGYRVQLSSFHDVPSDLPIVNDQKDLTLKGDGMALCVSTFTCPPSPGH
jgi:hypothetical protein